jgi:ABC-type Fe3+-siderophore transport system permease subunit
VAVSFAKRLVLVVFAALTLRGLVSGAGFEATLWTALVSIPTFLLVGLVCGELARRIVEEQVDRELSSLAADASATSLPDTERA